MKNTEKLKLKDLKVSSFVTSLNNNDSQTVKGGTDVTVVSLTATLVALVVTAVYESTRSHKGCRPD